MPLILSGDTGVPASGMPTGSVIQTVSTTLTTAASYSVNNSYSAVAGLTATITPISATSKIMIFVTMTVGSDTNYLNAQLTKAGTAIPGSLATSYGSRTPGTGSFWPTYNYATYSLSMNYLDSPATTSATSYGVQIGNFGGANLCVNRSYEDSDSAARTRGTSTITLLEIKQ